MSPNEIASSFAVILFIIAIILLLILRQMTTVKSNVTSYSKGKIPVNASYYSPKILSLISPNFALIHNLSGARLYISSEHLFVKVIFETEILKREISKIEIILRNNNPLDLKSKKIRIHTQNSGVYSFNINTEKISMKQTIAKFEEFGYDLIIK